MRIGNKEDHGYFGPMLSRIEKLIEEKMSFFGVESFSELTDEIDSMADLIDTIKVHEWGLCMPIKSTITKAKCFDKNTKMPDYSNLSTFANCSGCINLLSNEACTDDIKRIASSMTDTLESYPVLSGGLRKVYEGSLRRANTLLQQQSV